MVRRPTSVRRTAERRTSAPTRPRRGERRVPRVAGRRLGPVDGPDAARRAPRVRLPPMARRGASHSPSGFTIDKLTTTASVSGDTATVQLEGSGKLTSSDDPGTWQVGGTCPNNQIDLYGVGDTSGTSDPSGALDQTYSRSASRQICLAGDLGDVPLGLFAFSAGSEAQPSGPITINVVAKRSLVCQPGHDRAQRWSTRRSAHRRAQRLHLPQPRVRASARRHDHV